MKTVDLRACIDQSCRFRHLFSLSFLSFYPHAHIRICSGSTGKARI
jgi:hypothetical protein